MSLPFLLKGQAAAAAWKKDAAAQQARREAAKSNVFRYRLPLGKERRITFLDGDLNADGLLMSQTILEHNVKMGGRWGNHFVCTNHEGEGAEPCPLCEGGDQRYYVAFFTVVDHSKYTDSKGVDRHCQIRLFAAKSATLERLQMLAGKRGGLTGCTFDVSRSGEKAAACGDIFDYVAKHPLEKLVPVLSKKGGWEAPGVINYEQMLSGQWKTAAQLREMGFGSGMPTDTGSSPAPTASGDGDDDLDGLL